MRTLHLTTSRRSFLDQQVDALRSRGIDCTILNVPGDYSAESPRTLSDYLKYYPQVLDHSLEEYDLVHANHGLTAPFALCQPTRPVVVTFWGSELMGDHGMITRLSRYSAQLADEVILPSKVMDTHIDAEYTYMPFPVETSLFEPMEQADARSVIGWDSDTTIVLFPYDPNRPEKDYARAERVVSDADVDAELRTVTGQPYEMMPYYLNASDAVLVTSRHESGPMVVREAAACNVPVISTDVGFVAETLAGIDNSAVCRSDVELTGALEIVLSKRERSNARQQIDELSPSTFGERLERVYSRALDKQEAVV